MTYGGAAGHSDFLDAQPACAQPAWLLGGSPSYNPMRVGGSRDVVSPIGGSRPASPDRALPYAGQLIDFSRLARLPPMGDTDGAPPASPPRTHDKGFKLPRAPAFMASPATAESARRSLYGPKTRARLASPGSGYGLGERLFS